MREVTRNRLLRRVDWRFLLPDPHPALTLSLVSGELADALALISDRVIAGPHGGEGRCDLVVAADPDPVTLTRAWSAIRPGGWAYTEWSSTAAGGPRGIRRRLAAAGFEQIRCYWPWPGPDRCLGLLPIETAAARDYFFLDHRPPPRRLGARLRRMARYATARLRAALGLRLPIYALARRPTASDDGGEAQDLLARAATAFRRTGSPRSPRLDWLLLTRGPRSISKIIALGFQGSKRRPLLAVKIARVPEAVEGLRREAEVLRILEASSDLAGVPRVLSVDHGPDWLAVAETLVLGAPLRSVLRRGSYRDLALRATDWLATLALHTTSAPPLPPRQRLVQPILDQFAQSFGPVVDQSLLRVTAERLSHLGSLPAVCEHRDFSPWNVFVGPEGDLGVLDWESAEPCGLPALDLLYFLTYLGFFLDGAMETGAWERSYRASLSPSSFTGAVHAECLSRYCGHTGLDPSTIPALRLLLWPLHSRSEFRRFTADAAAPPSAEALELSLFLRLWREEVRHLIEMEASSRSLQPSRPAP